MTTSPVTTPAAATVIGGVDTHKHTHYAAAVDEHGRLLDHREFPATDSGYLALLAWLRGHGSVHAIGVESTGSFGATLTRMLTAAGERVVEVNRPNRLASSATCASVRSRVRVPRSSSTSRAVSSSSSAA